MRLGRRSLLLGVPVALAGIRTLFAQGPAEPGQGAGQGPDTEPSPPVPIDAPPFEEPGPRPNPKALLKENDKKLKHDADQLLQAAQDLKKEADGTDDTGVLSVALIRKAEEVEKLARQIRDLAKAN